MANQTLTPEQFLKYPWDSVFKKTEHEVLAHNVMKILFRTGNTFRELTWDEYKLERQKDKNFSEQEKYYFNQVIEYCTTSDKAKTFSQTWNIK